MTLRHCTIAHIVDVEHGDRLCSIAIESQHNLQRTLDLVIEAATRSEGWSHDVVARLIAVEVGDSVIAHPCQMDIALGVKAWAEIRHFWCSPTVAAEVA